MKNKIYLAVNKDGQELILQADDDNDVPYRRKYSDQEYWRLDMLDDAIVYLPKGSIKKLIGRDLTWEDEPIIMEE